MALVLAAAGAAWAQGGDPNECDAEMDEPDVIVGELPTIQRWGALGGVTAFSIATTSCNVGTCWLDWIQTSNRHPVIGGNAYRLKDGRFEQIGQSWLKHGFFAVSEELCSTGCVGTDGEHLGVNCSDPYSAGFNGLQQGLGPKYQVNPHTGFFAYPFAGQGDTGDLLFKRLQIDNTDLDPGMNPGATFFFEGQYITPDDAAAGNGDNNASYREFLVTGSDGFYGLNFVGLTIKESPAIFGWKAADPEVKLSPVRVPNEGLLWLGSRATDLGNGMWNYEYALHNLNSHRGVGRFRIELAAGATVANVGFHDVDYHSGELQSPLDWAVVHEDGGPSYIEWSTEPVTQNPYGNALLWGTTYNFRFDTDAPPASGNATMGLWRAGTPDEVSAGAQVPTACSSSVDVDGDTFSACSDCDDANGNVWRSPGAVQALELAGSVTTVLTWSPPSDPGTSSSYDHVALRSAQAGDFTAATCLNVVGSQASDIETPASGGVYHYLVYATNDCPQGIGSLGQSSDGTERTGRTCP